MNREMLVFISIGFELVGLMVAGSYLGTYLDQKYGSSGTWVSILCIGSLVGWLIHVLFLVKRMDSNKDQTK